MTPFPPVSIPFRSNVWIAARLLPLFVRDSRLDRLLAMATPPRQLSAFSALDADIIAATAKRAARRPWVMRDRRCLREGLLAFHYLSLAGHRPLLHFAIEKASLTMPKPAAHCWVTVGGRILMNPPSATMIDMFAWDGERSIKPEQAGAADARGIRTVL
jgi:hypothetical protein